MIARLLTTTALVAALAPGASALAQEAAGASRARVEDSGEIIVTARRSEESLQDVPISITVVTPEQISQRNIVTASDLATYTPSLSVNNRFGPDKSSFVIRGFVQEQYTAPSVGVYFAEVVAPRSGATQTGGNGTGPGSFFDLQNVQVLKGPQGTLFGRNTTGGAVLLTPRKPVDHLEGYLEGTLGNYGARRLQGALNLPVTDTLRVRLSFDRNKTDGYQRNHSGIGPDRYGDVDYWAARLSVVADLTPDLENYLIASFSDSDTNGTLPRIFACDPTRRTQAAINGCDQIARQNARGDGNWDVESANPFARQHVRQWQLIDTLTWHASDSVTVKNIVSYAQFNEAAALSLNGDNFTVRDLPGAQAPASRSYIGLPYQFVGVNPGPRRGETRQETITEELQVQGVSLDGALKWQLGGYLELSNPLTGNEVLNAINLSCTDAVALQCVSPFGASGSLGRQRIDTRFNNKGFYGQATFNLTSKLAITGGLRYTIDRMRVVDQSTRYRFPVNGAPVLICANSVRFRNPDGTALIVQDQAQCRNTFRANSEKPTWLIDAEYKPTDDTLLYAKYTRGYRQGGIASGNIGLETWGPEKVDNYEIGAKAKFDAGAVRGYFDIAGFYNDFSNQQITGFLQPRPGSGFPGGSAIVNAGKSIIKGIEVDSSATLFGQLKLDAGYTYLDTKVKDIVQPVVPDGAPYLGVILSSQPGDTLALSPKHRLTLGGTWTVPLDESIGRISIGGTYVYTSSQISTKASPFGTMPSSNLVNANIAWNDVLGQPIDLSAFVTNLTKEFAPTAVVNGWATSGYEAYVANLPRMWGVRLKYRFGS